MTTTTATLERMYTLRFFKVWEDSLELKWERVFRDTRRILKFFIKVTSQHYNVERHFGFAENSFKLHALEPGSELTVTLKVLVESDGVQEWLLSDEQNVSTIKTPNITVAHVFPDKLHGRLVKDKAVCDTTLDTVDPTISYQQVGRYEINVVEKDRLFASHACNLEVSGDATEFTTPDLRTDMVYFVKIRAVSDSGVVGQWSDPVRFLTLRNVIVTLQEVGETYSLIRWHREGLKPGETTPAEDTYIEELCLELLLLPDKRTLELDSSTPPMQILNKIFSRDFAKFLVEDLIPGREYVVRTRYRNSYGDFCDWVNTPLSTLAPIMAPQISLVTHNYIQAWWQRGFGTGNVVAEMYKDVKSWEVKCVNTETKEVKVMQLQYGNVESRFAGLTEGSEYSLAVRALDVNNKWGPWSESTLTSTLHNLTPRCDMVGETWLNVAWDRTEKRYNDNISRYHIQISCATSPFRVSKYFPASETSFVFDLLKPSTTYLVAVQACSEDKWGPWSLPTEMRTCKPPGISLIRRSEDVVHLQWNCEYFSRNKIEVLDQRYMIRIMNGPQLVIEEETTISNYRRSGLTPGSHLSAYVRAFDYQLFTWSSWSEEFVITTLSCVVTPTSIGETFIQVSWNRHPKLLSSLTDSELAKGAEDTLSSSKPLKYILRISSVSKGGLEHELSKFHLSVDHPTFYTIGDLEPDNTYSVQLSVLDTNGIWSPYSAPNLIRTAPALLLAVEDVGEHYCNLLWSRPSQGKASTETMNSTMESRIVCKNLDDASAAPIKFHCIGDMKAKLRDLSPNTTYEVRVSSKPTNIESWGTWSNPIHIRTSTSLMMELESVGESYAHLLWHREVPPTVSYQNAETLIAGGVGSTSVPNTRDGNYLYIGDPTPTEYHVKIFKSQTSELLSLTSADAGKQLVFELYLAETQSGVRVPALAPSTSYEAVVCACTKTGEWGQWSRPLPFITPSPTELRVESITQDYIRCSWGQTTTTRADREDSVSHYQLKLVGMDDDFNLEVTLPPHEKHYDIRNLSVNSCYAVCVRPFMVADNDWGPFCNRAFICVRAIQVELQEAREDMLLVRWENRAVVDNRMKVLLLTLVGEKTSTTMMLESNAATSYLYKGLDANACYTVHLLCIEQSPCYLKNGGFVPLKNRRKFEVSAKDISMQTISMPIIASDYSNVLADGMTVYTDRKLLLKILRVGENFAYVQWGKGDDSNENIVQDSVSPLDEFEISVSTVDNTPISADLVAFTKMRHNSGHVVIKPLLSKTKYRIAIRCISRYIESETMWSPPCTFTTLRTVVPVLGGIEISATDERIQAMGEDYITFNWIESMHDMALDAQSSSLKFEARIMNTLTQAEVSLVEVTECVHTFANLEPDTEYSLSVRTVLTYAEPIDSTACCSPTTRTPFEINSRVLGEWSQTLSATTLGPMVVRVVNAAETFATIQWRRSMGNKISWEDNSSNLAMLSSISSFHLRVKETVSGHFIFEQQFLEGDREYDELSAMLRSLQPGLSYTVLVRASTMNQWGSWSHPESFSTLTAPVLKVDLIGEDSIYIQWTRAVDARASLPVKSWEISCTTIGQENTPAITHVSPDHLMYKLNGLINNTSYNIRLRPLYMNGLHGAWSNQILLTTLPSLKVEVSRIGETFVYVTWGRLEQKRISSKLRKRFTDARKSTDMNTTEEPISLSEIITDDADHRHPPQAAHPQPQQPTKLQEMQILEMEKESLYPSGDDLKYEVVVTNAATTVLVVSDDPASTMSINSQAMQQQQQKRQRRKIDKGQTSCRIENLDPQSTYNVVVRAVFTNGIDCSQYISVNHTPVSTPTTSQITPSSTGGGATDMKKPESDELGEWGPWSQQSNFNTLKPIVLITRGVCSESIVVEWDTGSQKSNNPSGSMVTAISKYELSVVEKNKVKTNPYRLTTAIQDPHVKSFTIPDLTAGTMYTAKIRVCYEEDKWGVWSDPVNVLTLPLLNAQVQNIGDHKVEFLVWRDEQSMDDPQFVPWKQPNTRHQLRINTKQTPQPFTLEYGTSTLLTLDALMLDTRYEICVRDEDVNGDWTSWNPLLLLETPPAPPGKPILRERRGNTIALSWDHNQTLSASHRYIYQIELAELMENESPKKQLSKSLGGRSTPSSKGKSKPQREHGPFKLVGSTFDTMYRFEIEKPVNECFFRVRACKEGHTLEECEAPATLTADDEGHVVVTNENVLLWSKWSVTANYRTPSIPDHPSELHVTHLTHNTATLRWSPPANSSEHDGLLYKIFLSNVYGEPFTYLGTTDECKFPLVGLVPNCHYRAMVGAESRMGNSKNNKTLHFSTKIMKDAEPSYHPLWVRAATTLPTATSPLLRQRMPSFSNPTTTSLPPRSGIRVGSFAFGRKENLQSQVSHAMVLLAEERNKLLSARTSESIPRANRIAPLASPVPMMDETTSSSPHNNSTTSPNNATQPIQVSGLLMAGDEDEDSLMQEGLHTVTTAPIGVHGLRRRSQQADLADHAGVDL
eukprot:PhF_6_TR7881/c0_g1_i1/m.11572